MMSDKLLAVAPIGAMGAAPPKSVEELVWYAFGLLGAYFLWSIKTELVGLRRDVKEEMKAREAIDLRLTRVETRCIERGCVPDVQVTYRD